MTENEAQLKQQFAQARGRIGRLATTLVGEDAAKKAVDDAEIVVCTCYEGMDFTIAGLLRLKNLVEGLKRKSILSTL